jgi:hypothetical protein
MTNARSKHSVSLSIGSSTRLILKYAALFLSSFRYELFDVFISLTLCPEP